MRLPLIIPLLMLAFGGCATDPAITPTRIPFSVRDLGLSVRDEPRTYMQSDRRGAFLVGTAGRGSANGNRWSLEGTPLVEDIIVETAAGELSAAMLDSSTILPHETRRFYAGGSVVTMALLEGLSGPDTHGLLIRVLPFPAGTVAIRPVLPPGGAQASLRTESHALVYRRSDGRKIIFSAGPGGRASGERVTVDASGLARFLVLVLPPQANPMLADSVIAVLETLAVARETRMNRLLNASYIRTSDDTLTRTIQWIKLSVDALMITRRDTFAVDGLPWDGSIDVRANLQSIAGLGLATGDYRQTAGILRSLARYQDDNRKSRTYGRIADRVAGGRPSYGAADVGPWFVRELYEHVVYANDTGLVRAVYPTIRRSLEGTIGSHTDTFNFLTHGPRETWMSDINRGNRAVEVQLLWYFQQLIGSFVADYLGDSVRARTWRLLSSKTIDNFELQFADSATMLLADHLGSDGTKNMAIRPNALMSLDLLDGEAMRFRVTGMAVRELLKPYGVATFSGVRAKGMSAYNGPVWTWLAGPMAYALSRYDRQDLMYVVTKTMARVALTRDMAGTLPAMLEPEPAGDRASLTGMAEFLRVMYQDYLGLRIDLTVKTITVQPKLPDDLTHVDFTVYAGTHPIHGVYSRDARSEYVLLEAPEQAPEMTVAFLWTMLNGDAWRGSARLRGGTPMLLVMRTDDVVLMQGGKRGECEAKRLMRQFSQRATAAEFAFSRQ